MKQKSETKQNQLVSALPQIDDTKIFMFETCIHSKSGPKNISISVHFSFSSATKYVCCAFGSRNEINFS